MKFCKLTQTPPWFPVDFDHHLTIDVKHEYTEREGFDGRLTQFEEIEEIENNENEDYFGKLSENAPKTEPPVKRKRKENTEKSPESTKTSKTPTKRERQRELAEQHASDRAQVLRTCKICDPNTSFLAEKVHIVAWVLY